MAAFPAPARHPRPPRSAPAPPPAARPRRAPPRPPGPPPRRHRAAGTEWSGAAPGGEAGLRPRLGNKSEGLAAGGTGSRPLTAVPAVANGRNERGGNEETTAESSSPRRGSGSPHLAATDAGRAARIPAPSTRNLRASARTRRRSLPLRPRALPAAVPAPSSPPSGAQVPPARGTVPPPSSPPFIPPSGVSPPADVRTVPRNGTYRRTAHIPLAGC